MPFRPLLLAAALACGAAVAQVPEVQVPRFTIDRISVEGNSLLPQAEIDAILAPHLGQNRDFGDVQRALEALQAAYLARGYSAVRVLVPEQNLVGGVVRLQVIEARVREIHVEGNRFFDADNVRASLPALKPGEAPNTARIGENVQLINENPAKQATVLLQATDEAGKTDALVRVADEAPQRFSVSLDNTGTPQTGSLRAGFGYQNANVGNRDHVFTAQFITSPTRVNDVKILGAAYHLPLYAWNSALDAFAAYSDVSAGTIDFAGSPLAVSGSGTLLGARWSYVLPRIAVYEHKLAAQWDYKAFKQNLVPAAGGPNLLGDVTAHPVSILYTGRFSRVGSDLSFLAAYSQNLPGGNDGTQDAFTLARAGAPARYHLWRFAGALSYALPKDYLARAVVNAQYTRDPLIPGEQFGMGGQDSVRGFYEREVASDQGYRVSGELYTPDVGERVGAGWRARFVAFLDLANGRDREPVRSVDNGIASVGAGLRMSLGRTVSVRMDLAHVLNPSSARPDNKNRLHFALVYSF